MIIINMYVRVGCQWLCIVYTQYNFCQKLKLMKAKSHANNNKTLSCTPLKKLFALSLSFSPRHSDSQQHTDTLKHLPDTWALVRFCDCPNIFYIVYKLYMRLIHFINIVTSSIKYQSMLTGAKTCLKPEWRREYSKKYLIFIK